MSTQVGEGYIEIEPRFNKDVFNRLSAAASRSMASHFSKNFSTAVNRDLRNGFGRAFDGVDRDVDRRTNVIHDRYKRKVDRDSNIWGRMLGKNIAHGFEGVLSLLPARLESIFTKTGPIIGTVLMAGVAAAVALALPALGAMISGALFSVVGLGAALGAVIVGAINDKRVDAAVDRFKKNFTAKVINAPAVQSLGATLAKNLDRVTAALNRWAPAIQGILKAGEKFMTPMFTAFIKSMDILLPVMDKLSNSKFMNDLMRVMNAGVVKIFEAFAISFNRFLADPQAMEGATKGLELFFNLLAATIKTLFDFLRLLSRLYAAMSADGGAFDRIRATWKGFRDAINTVVFAIGAVVRALVVAFQAFLRWNNMGAQFAALWRGSIVPAVQAFVGAVVAAARLVFGIIAGIAKGVWQVILTFWRAVGAALTNNLKGVVNGIFGMLKGFFKLLEGLLVFFKGLFTLNWSEMWRGIRIIFVGVWTFIFNFGKVLWRAIQAAFNIFTGIMKVVWISMLGQMRRVWDIIWAAIAVVGRAVWTAIRNYFIAIWTAQARFFMAIWTAVKNFFVSIWNAIYSFVVRIFTAIAGWLRSRLTLFLAYWRVIWNGILSFLINIWNSITNAIRRAWTTVSSWLISKLDAIRKTWANIWQGMHNVLAGVWRNIQSAVQSGINGVINIINKGIDLINGILGKLGIAWKIPKLGIVGGPGGPLSAANTKGATIKGAHHKASGGRMFGPGSTTSDSIHTMLSKDEYVVRASSAKKFGYNKLDYLNTHGKLKEWGARGYASGGRVGAGNNALLEQHRNHVHVAMAGPPMSYPQIIAAAKRSGIPFSVSSTYRPGSRGSGGGLDHHSEGRAVDFAGFNQDRLASYFEHLAGVIELIHRSNLRDYAIFGGKGATSGGGGLFAFLGKGWNWIMDHMLKPVGNKAQDLFGKGNFMAEFGRGAVKGIFNGIVGKVKKEFDDAQKMADAGAFADAGGGGSQRWAGVATRALQILGLPGSWLGPLLRLIQRESGGNPRAQNNSDSNAAKGTPSKGLMQTIGPTFAAYAMRGFDRDIFDPLSNILAGLRYIKARYGSIFNVQQAVGATPKGYDNGGWVGNGIWGNYSNKPEMVLNNAQGAALEQSIRSLGGGNTTHVYIDGVEVAHRAVVHENNAEIIRTLRAGQK